MMKYCFRCLLFFLTFSGVVHAEEAFLMHTELQFSNGTGFIQQENQYATSDVIMYAKGELLLSDGTIISGNYKHIMDFYDSTMVGMIMPFAMDELPFGWILCDGREIQISGTQNAELQSLANKLQDTWGGSGSVVNGRWVGTFKVPDLRGYFIRGADDMTVAGTNDRGEDVGQRYSDPARSIISTAYLGTYQNSGYTAHGSDHVFTIPEQTTSVTTPPDHTHLYSNLFDPVTEDWDANNDYTVRIHAGNNTTDLIGQTTATDITHTHTVTYAGTVQANTDLEPRPKNFSVIYGIRF